MSERAVGDGALDGRVARHQREVAHALEQPSGDAPPPIAAVGKEDDGDDARCRQNNVSRPPQRNQIGVVLVDGCENEDWSDEPDEDDADTLEDLHEADGACGDGTRRLPVSNLPGMRERISASARKLHKNPELLLRVLQATAQRRQIVRPANQGRSSNACSHTTS